jgi:DHA1 family tetracycline resistance protein-like MFS transporter
VIYGLAIQSVIFTGYGLATESWMILVLIMLGSLGGIAGPAIQSIVAGEVEPSNQGKVQGGITSLISLTNIAAPLIFTSGIFGYFTSDVAIVRFPGAPLVVGGLLLFVAMRIARGVFRRLEGHHSADDGVEDVDVEDSVASATGDTGPEI